MFTKRENEKPLDIIRTNIKSEPGSLAVIPDEIMVRILRSNLNAKSLLDFSLTCNFFYSFSQDASVWRKLVKKHFNGNVPKDVDPKQYYRQLHHEHRCLLAYLLAIDFIGYAIFACNKDETLGLLQKLEQTDLLRFLRKDIEDSPGLALEKIKDIQQLCKISDDHYARIAESYQDAINLILQVPSFSCTESKVRKAGVTSHFSLGVRFMPKLNHKSMGIK